MKKIINYSRIVSLLILAPVFILVCCSKDSVKDNLQNSLPGTTTGLIKVSGEGALETTKTTLSGLVTSWVATADKVGIYSPTARTLTGGAGDPVVNAQFTAASSGVSSTFNGTMYWGAANTSHTFYAYYPYEAGSSASTAVPVSLPAAQTQASANSNAHIGELDFLVANPVTVTSPDNTNAVANEVNLRYNHLFTVIEFQIAGTGDLKGIKLSGNSTLAFSGGTIDITQATPDYGIAYNIASPTVTNNEVTVILTNSATLTSTNSDTKVYMVINPGTPTGSCLIGVSADGTTWNYLEKTAPVGGFKRGVKYVVTLDAVATTLENVVVGRAGAIWMDRNLGATQVATSSTDAHAFGYLYQWGRGTDGHQLRGSGTTTILSNLDTPGHGNFILPSSNPYDWRDPQNNNLWQGASGTNNPCPSGFRLPTETELNNERLTWSSNNSAGAFASPLKLTMAGYRSWIDGSLSSVGSFGSYWTSTDIGSRYLFFKSDDAFLISGSRSWGFSVRCIKD